MKSVFKHIKKIWIWIVLLLYGVLEILLSDNAKDSRLYLGIIMLFIMGSVIMTLVINMREKIELHSLGFFFVLLWGIIIGMVMPPGIAPDEPRHFMASYELSNRLLGTSRYDMLSEETGFPIIMMRKGDLISLTEYVDWQQGVYLEEYNVISNSDFMFSQKSDLEMVEEHNYTAATSKLFKYIPSAIGISLARILHLGKYPLIYIGRFFNLLFFSICLFFGVKQLDKGKYALMSIATMPYLLCLASSYSYDAISNGLAIVFLTCFFSMYENETRINKKNIIIMLSFYVLLLPFKEIYVVFGLLILVLGGKYINKGKKILKELDKKTNLMICVGLIFFIAIVLYREIPQIMKYVVGLYEGNRLTFYGEYVQYYGLKDFIFEPKKMFYLLFDSISLYLAAIIQGSFTLPWVGISTISYWGLFACCILVVLQSAADGYDVKLKKYCLITFSSMLLLAMVGCALTMTTANLNTVYGFQARYMQPAITMLMIVCGTNETFSSRLKKIFAFQNIFLIVAVLYLLRKVVIGI